jgi:CubicO group peptidase (beta-lactamase class C family)
MLRRTVMDFTKLDKFIDDMPLRGIPMFDLAVSYKGETVYRHMSGHSDEALTVPASDKDIYWIFSNTKVTTCIAALRLIDEGKMALEDKLSKYIPEFDRMFVRNQDGTITPAKNPITLLHLFTMTAGFDYNLSSAPIKEAVARGGYTLDVARAISTLPLWFEPGTHYRYSLCHDVLAAVVEVVSGMRFSDYCDENIFKPLGMSNTGFRPSAEQAARISAMYNYHSGLNKAIPTESTNKFYALTDNYDSGGAGLFSTPEDYLKLLTAVALGGTAKNGYKLLSPETVKLMGKNFLCDDARKDFSTTRTPGYGWGLCGRAHVDPVVSLSLSSVGEFGWDGAAGALSVVDPTNEVAIYLGTHVKGCQYIYHQIHPRIINMVLCALGLGE